MVNTNNMIKAASSRNKRRKRLFRFGGFVDSRVMAPDSFLSYYGEGSGRIFIRDMEGNKLFLFCDCLR